MLFGPAYGLSGFAKDSWGAVAVAAGATAGAFCLAASGCYVINDIYDAEADRAHPRKRRRPIASGAVTPTQGWVFAGALFAGAAGAVAVGVPGEARWWVMGLLLAYVLNVAAYSSFIKHIVIADVMSLSMGFVLRVLAGCAAVGIGPSTWLLNCTLFLAMFLAFGKRLGERRTVEDAGKARAVQLRYTDDLLRMAVVVTAVALLVAYAGYVGAQGARFELQPPTVGGMSRVLEPGGLNVLWLTILPATYALLRCIVLVERGEYDDPTELAVRDRPTQLAVAAFGAITLAAMWWAGR